MDDPDVIAYLFPAEGTGYRLSNRAINMEANNDRFVPPRPQEPDIVADRFERAATEQPDDEDNIGHNNIQEEHPCLKLRFSQPPKTRNGLVAGRCPGSDIVLPDRKGVSWLHFALTFDRENRLVVRDLGSTIGTRVLYGDEEDSARGYRMDFSAHGPPILRGRAPVIKIRGDLQFKLIVPNHNTTSRAYLENVERFRQGTAATENLFASGELINRTQTELPTPSSDRLVPDSEVPGPMLWTKEIGRGGFGIVYYAWDVTTRKEYALKKPLPGQYFNRASWLKEGTFLKSLRHDNIVELKHAILDDGPELYLEYVHMGSLAQYQRSATSLQRKDVILQVLSALEYLHGQEDPIVHRDIKPENIFVKEWSLNKVHVKLGDFGLSKKGKLLKTFCGSVLYLAPEGYTDQTDAMYSPKVDIWAVGVLEVWLETGKFPKYRAQYKTDGMAWAQVMVEFGEAHLRRCGSNELLAFAIHYMLVIHPANRWTARKCRAGVELLATQEAECSPETEYGDAVDDNSGEEEQTATPGAPTAADDELGGASGTSIIRPSLFETLGQ